MSIDMGTFDREIVIAPPHTAPPPATDQAIKLLARSLGRQAARRHLARGWSMMEVALALVVAALVVAAALYLTTPIERLP